MLHYVNRKATFWECLHGGKTVLYKLVAFPCDLHIVMCSIRSDYRGHVFLNLPFTISCRCDVGAERHREPYPRTQGGAAAAQEHRAAAEEGAEEQAEGEAEGSGGQPPQAA